MLKNLKLSTKLWGLTAFLLLAVMAVAGNSLWSINSILETNGQYSDAAGQNTFMVKKEVDHLNWINRVQDMFVGNAKTLEVQLDHTKCGLGKFLYGDEARALAASDPNLATLLEAIKEPHKHLHESGAHIKHAWRQVHQGLGLTLAARLDDHRRWAAKVSEALLQGQGISVEMDPAKCAFGKWLGSEEVRTLAAAWPEFSALISQVREPHEKLHQSVAKITAARTAEEKAEAYSKITVPALHEVAGIFADIQNLEADLETGQAEAHHAFETETLPALSATQEKMKTLTDALDSKEGTAQKAMGATGSQSKWSATAVTVAAIVVGILLSFFLIRSITKPIGQIIASLTEGADQVASASGQVSSAGQQLAEGSSEQAASLEETSSSLEEMSSMTKQNADNAGQANSLMKEANQVVGRANDSMRELTGSMEEISKASQETSKIIKTIDEIAFQTNLLALNAAVEAARAGEAGAGFAVVADEVRNLAMRAADAAKNTAGLIEGTVKKVKDGAEIVNNTNEAFTEVAKSASKVGELVGEIAAASNEQAQGIDQVNKAVAEMDKVVQSTAANAEESASAAEEMNAQAEQMKDIVGNLVAIVGGSQKNGQASHHGPMDALKALGSKTGTRVRSLAVPAKRAGSPNMTVAKEPKPEQVIPLEEENAFRDF